MCRVVAQVRTHKNVAHDIVWHRSAEQDWRMWDYYPHDIIIPSPHPVRKYCPLHSVHSANRLFVRSMFSCSISSRSTGIHFQTGTQRSRWGRCAGSRGQRSFRARSDTAPQVFGICATFFPRVGAWCNAARCFLVVHVRTGFVGGGLLVARRRLLSLQGQTVKSGRNKISPFRGLHF